MADAAFIPAVLEGEHWNACGAGYPTLDEAIEAVKSHFRHQPTTDTMKAMWQKHPELEFRKYKSEGHPWNATIVEIGPDLGRPMMALAVYKILGGQWAPKVGALPEEEELHRELDAIDNEDRA